MSLKNWMLRRTLRKRGVKLSPGSRIETTTEIGDGTRINGPLFVKGHGECRIGRYCALGADIKIVTTNHLIDFPNLQCFSDVVCQQLKALAWWHWEQEKIARNQAFFDLDLTAADTAIRLADHVVE